MARPGFAGDQTVGTVAEHGAGAAASANAASAARFNPASPNTEIFRAPRNLVPMSECIVRSSIRVNEPTSQMRHGWIFVHDNPKLVAIQSFFFSPSSSITFTYSP